MSKDAINFATRNTLPVMARRPMTAREAGAAFQHLALMAQLRESFRPSPGQTEKTR